MISRIKSIYFSIRGFYYRNLTPSTLYYRTKYGILNLIIWFPIIWRDRNWDHSYMFEMLEYKLSLMEKLFRKYGHSVNSEKDAHYIMICKNLCKRLADDEYTNPYEERNRLHHEWFSRKFEEAMNKEPNKNGFITVVRRHEPDEPDDRWILPAHEHEEYLANQDLELLCRLIRKHSRGWWD